jgi:DNA-binding response OmpR family regulator
MELGADEYITKPFTADQLLAVVAAIAPHRAPGAAVRPDR